MLSTGEEANNASLLGVSNVGTRALRLGLPIRWCPHSASLKTQWAPGMCRIRASKLCRWSLGSF